MKKKELIERIAEEAGVPKSEAQKHFEAFEEVVTQALKAGEEVLCQGAQGQGGKEPPDGREIEDQGFESSLLQRRQRS
jgi:hypothetical protein